MNDIYSSQNKTVKKVMSLKEKKYRDKYNAFIVEGIKFVDEIRDDWNVQLFVISESFANAKDTDKYFKKSEVCIVSDSLFGKMCETKNPQGILAVCQQKEFNINSILKKENIFLLVCEEINDPGNLGTLIRTADAGGCDGVIVTQGSVDVYNSKTIRATAGSIFHIPIIKDISIESTLDILSRNNIKTIGTHLKGSVTPYETNMKISLGLLVGNEANGLSEICSNKCDTLVKLPMIGNAESLNASMACGILIYEVVRQRL